MTTKTTYLKRDFRFNRYTGDLILRAYCTGSYAIIMGSEELGPIATVTTNIPGLAPDEFAIKSYSENDGMLEALLEQGVIQQPHRYERSGFVMLPICRLVTPVAEQVGDKVSGDPPQGSDICVDSSVSQQ